MTKRSCGPRLFALTKKSPTLRAGRLITYALISENFFHCNGRPDALRVHPRPAQPANPTYIFSHLAGPLGGRGNADGSAPDARFYNPNGIAIDAAGNLYVADEANSTVRKITPNGTVTTLAGLAGTAGSSDGTGSSASFFAPTDVAVDAAGNVYVADATNHTIRKITPAGTVTTVAGSAGTAGSADGIGSAARFNYPNSVCVDSAGNVYVTDFRNFTIRKIDASGTVTTVAGSAGVDGHADGTGGAASFYFPSGISVDSAGTLYVADAGNVTIRRITAGGVVTTLAGTAGVTGSADGLGSAAQFGSLNGLAADSAGNVFVADQINNTIRKITLAGAVSTLAGSVGVHGSPDGTGSAARFYNPADVAADAAGNLYVADASNNTVRKITSAGQVSTQAGMAGDQGTTDGAGTAALFYYPSAVAVDGTGTIYVADEYNQTIRKITSGGTVSTFAGTAGVSGAADGVGSSAQFNYPSGVATDSTGNVYVADATNQTIRKITSNATVTTLAGSAGVSGSADGSGSSALFWSPTGVAVDSTGNVFVADFLNNTIRKITPTGAVTTLAGKAGNPGSADGTGTAAQFNSPSSVAVDSSNNVYVADMSNGTVRKISAGGVVTTLAGSAGQWGATDGTGSAARFSLLLGIAVDGSGNVFVADGGIVRKITASGVVTTVAGTANIFGSADGIGTAAQFNYVHGVAVDGSGNLYVADYYNNAIRKGQLAGPPVITAQPQSQSVQAGAKVLLSATITSSLPLTYQWYLNNTAVAGANGSFLEIPSASFASGGAYTLTAANQLGSVTTNAAVLTVAPIPATSGGGGGSMEPWFALALLGFELARRKQKRNAYFNRTRFEVR